MSVVTKQFDTETGQHSLLFQVDYPEIALDIVPKHRFMSSYEQVADSVAVTIEMEFARGVCVCLRD